MSITVCDRSEAGVVEVAGVAADAGDDYARLEEGSRGGEGVVIDQPRRGVNLKVDTFLVKLSVVVMTIWLSLAPRLLHVLVSESPYLVGHALEEDRRGRDLLLGGEEPVGEVAAVGQVQPHDAPVGLHQRRVHREVARGPAT